MRLPRLIPSHRQLAKAYSQLLAKKVSEKNMIMYSSWSRFDPRLGELLVSFLHKEWFNLNPMMLRALNDRSAWPQAFAVILEHIADSESSKSELFEHFKNLILTGLKPVPYQSFTIGLWSVGSPMLVASAINPHPFFKKWGFHEKNPFINKVATHKSKTHIKAGDRKRILHDLLKTHQQINVNDYMAACNYAIHRRQAERDLLMSAKLKTTGRTRAKVYLVK